MMHDPDVDGPQVRDGYWAALLAQGEVAPALDDTCQSWPDPLERPRGHACARFGAETAYDDAFWTQLRELQAGCATIEAPVIGCNKGGLLVRVCEGIGFIPASQLVELPQGLGTLTLRDELQTMVGRKVSVRVIEIDPARARVICSERAATANDDSITARLNILAERVGAVETGVVRSVCDFGVFVDLGDVDGLIHISELSWQRVGHPSEIMHVDQPVEVVVVSVDRDSKRVALSTKRLCQDPWDLVAARYHVGDIVEAIVSNVVEFGAFARVPEGIDGLIHISELAEGTFFHPSSVVAEGDVVLVKVLHIDPGGRRLGLSLRQA